jgi:hypothetical protein
MLVVCIAEPVPETRELLARLVARRGDRAALWLPHDGLGPDHQAEVDVLLFEPLSAIGRQALDYVRDVYDEAVRIAVTVAHQVLPDDHGGHHLLVHPFAPQDLGRVLDTADVRQNQQAV